MVAAWASAREVAGHLSKPFAPEQPAAKVNSNGSHDQREDQNDGQSVRRDIAVNGNEDKNEPAERVNVKL